jgi:hypothetical protein
MSKNFVNRVLIITVTSLFCRPFNSPFFAAMQPIPREARLDPIGLRHPNNDATCEPPGCKSSAARLGGRRFKAASPAA